MSLEHAIERLRNALQMHNEHRTTMQSLAGSVADFLRDAATLKAAQGGVTEGAYRNAVQAWIDRADLDFPARLLAALEAALEAALSAPEPAAQGEAKRHCNLCGGTVVLANATKPTVDLGKGSKRTATDDARASGASKVVDDGLVGDPPLHGNGDRKLDAPARVGVATFGKGVRWSTVISAAQRAYEYRNEPKLTAEQIAAFYIAFPHLAPDPEKVRAAHAALSAEPAAQGEAVAWQYRRLDEEEGPSPYWHHMTREQYEMFRDNPRSNCEVRQLFTAPPAQPAERVPGAYVMDSGFKYESVGKHIPTVLVGFAPDDFDARDRFAAMLAASPAPSEGGKGVEGVRKLAKYQPCGCVICTCEDEVQCHGCGAHHCGSHPVAEFDNPAYTTGAAR